MKIRFVQSGGVTGAVKSCALDTATLPDASGPSVEQLVADSGLDRSGTYLSPAGRDLQEYELTIEGHGPAVSVTLDDASIPAAAKPLIAYLKKRARPGGAID